MSAENTTVELEYKRMQHEDLCRQFKFYAPYSSGWIPCWVVVFQSYKTGDKIGYGDTPIEAIHDLMDEAEESKGWNADNYF